MKDIGDTPVVDLYGLSGVLEAAHERLTVSEGLARNISPKEKNPNISP